MALNGEMQRKDLNKMANNFAGRESVQEKFKSVLPFRGQLADVREANNDPEGIVGLAKLGWEAKKEALSIAGRPWQNKYGIVRDEAPYPAIDGGKPCSKEFQLLKNPEVVGDVAGFAKEWGLVITHAGAIGGGEFVLAYASSPKLADIAGVDKGYATHFGDLGKGANQDLVEAGVLMVASHQPGFKSMWIPKATRFLCTNGVVIGEAMAMVAYKLGHREKSGEGYQRERVGKVFEEFEKRFGEWCEMARGFGQVDLPEVAQKAYLAEVMDPELWERILMATDVRGRGGLEVDGVMAPVREAQPLADRPIDLDELLVAGGHGVLDRPSAGRLARIEVVEGLLGRDQSRRIVEELLAGLAGRSFGQVEEMMVGAPGQEGLGGLARPYHALTHWVDHHRGRKGGDTAVESQEWGPGSKMKIEAGKVGRLWMKDLEMAGKAGRS
jgi:hypothetical protein